MKLQLTPTAPRPDVRRLLAAELARRCADNPQYSLRAFALQLGLDHGTLGQMLRGRRAITARTVRELGARLRWPAEDTERLATAADAGAGAAALDGLNQLSHDAAAVLADGAHAALLELLHLRDFRPDVRWIARVLGLTEDEVCIALQRLLRLGLLEMPAPDRWVDRAGDAVADVPALARLAAERLAAHAAAPGPQVREHSSAVFAVPAARVPLLAERLAALRAELAELLASDEPADAVYRLELHLFPVTRHDGAPPPGA